MILKPEQNIRHEHYNDVIMSTMASQINSLTIVYSTVYSSADQRKHQSSASLAFVNRLFRCRSKKTSKLGVTGFLRGIYQWPVNSPHKWLVTRKLFPFDDVIMWIGKECRFPRRREHLYISLSFFEICLNSCDRCNVTSHIETEKCGAFIMTLKFCTMLTRENPRSPVREVWGFLGELKI